MEKKYFIGQIVSTQGLKGELRISLYEGYNDNFKNFNFFYIENEEFKIEKFRFKKNLLILKLSGIDDINVAEELIGKKLYLYKDDIKLEDNEFLIDEIIGFKAVFNNEEIGEIIDIDTVKSAQGVFVIKNSEKTFMVPLHNNFIEKGSKKRKYIVFKNIEGFIDEF
ncbi:ribosome maturation factor RimM [Clostridiaceae bacterium HSG29]|nr:ribosome maturation factor RimM [Clostridiaceae bacterium HSG29]